MDTNTLFHIRWRSWLGVSAAFFLLYGVLNFLLPLRVPYTLHTNRAWSSGGLVLTNEADLALLGSYASASQTADDSLNGLLIFGGLIFAAALLGRYGLRRGRSPAAGGAT